MESSAKYGVERYFPDPARKPGTIGLALSGGGFRATLFHLGSLRRLNELGLLTQIDTFSSASGGSITAAQLARHRLEHAAEWAERGRPIARFDEELAGPLRRFCGQDIRTTALVSQVYPWRWLKRGAAVEALADRLVSGPAGRVRLSDLPDSPRFVLCATDLRFRAQWVFDTGCRRIGSEPAGYAPLTDHWTLARAAAASACFPPAFAAMSVPDEPERTVGTFERDDDSPPRGLELSDGGLCDNLALEPVWRDHAAVLASDASPNFSPEPRMFGRLWLGFRYPVTLFEQAAEIRKRWLVASYVRGDLQGSYWGIASRPSRYPPGAAAHGSPPDAYPDELIQKVISQIRIDFDAFSKGESAVLENHGYLLADIALRSHAADLVEGAWPAARVPHPEWMPEKCVRKAFANSEQTNVFGRKR